MNQQQKLEDTKVLNKDIKVNWTHDQGYKELINI